MVGWGLYNMPPLETIVYDISNQSLIEEYKGAIEYMASQFSDMFIYFLKLLMGSLWMISRPLYITIFMIGLIMYLSRFNRWVGRDLMMGGVILALVTEFIFPAVIEYLNTNYP